MTDDSITPFPTMPSAAPSVDERDTFVDERLIRSMMNDGRLAVKQSAEKQQPMARGRILPQEEVVLGSWF